MPGTGALWQRKGAAISGVLEVTTGRFGSSREVAGPRAVKVRVLYSMFKKTRPSRKIFFCK